MKLLLFITGHRQLIEYHYFNRFLKRLELTCDIFIYCNNSEIDKDILTYYHEFNAPKRLFITTLNDGYRTGGVEAVSEGYDMGIFKDYDYVIHLHPDVFIIDDNPLKDILIQNLNNDTVFFITHSIPNEQFFSFDFFIFKPTLLPINIFKGSFEECPEIHFHNIIKKHNLKYTILPRFENNVYFPRRVDLLNLYHEHELDKVEQLLKEKGL